MTSLRVGAAHETLARAACFWTARTGALPDWADDPAGDVRARYTANCFRELDSFLRELLDAIAPTPQPQQRNTANRLGAQLARDRIEASGDPARLRAIGRSSACLFHCAGWVRRPDQAAGEWMTAGWSDAAGNGLRRYRLGDRLRPGPDEVAEVCRFFLRVGETVRA